MKNKPVGAMKDGCGWGDEAACCLSDSFIRTGWCFHRNENKTKKQHWPMSPEAAASWQSSVQTRSDLQVWTRQTELSANQRPRLSPFFQTLRLLSLPDGHVKQIKKKNGRTFLLFFWVTSMTYYLLEKKQNSFCFVGLSGLKGDQGSAGNPMAMRRLEGEIRRKQ